MWFGHFLIGKILHSLFCICLTILYFFSKYGDVINIEFSWKIPCSCLKFSFCLFYKKIKWHIYLNVIGGECYFRKSKNLFTNQSSLNLKKIGKFQKVGVINFYGETTSEEGICSLTYFKRFIEIFIALESFEAFKGNPKKVT